MSTWRIGNEVAANSDPGGVTFDARDGAGTPGDGTVEVAIDRLTKWIPGDALALYVAGVTTFAAPDDAQPSPALLLVFIVLSAAFVLGSVFAASGSIPASSWLPAILAAVAFTLWSLSVPFSGWQRWDLIADNQVAVALIAAVAGLLFGFIAEGLTKRAAR